MPIDLKSLHNTKKIKTALAAALDAETRPPIRKRLLALQAVLRGTSYADAARLAGARPASVSRWVETLQAEGLAAVLISDVRQRPLKPELAAAVRAEIAAALQRQPRWKIRNRLNGVDAFLSGQSLEAAAAIASVKPDTLRDAICQIRREGIATTLGKWEAPQECRPAPFEADPGALRAQAARENPPMRRRLLALAYLAEGLSADDAAIRVGLSVNTVRRHRRRFQHGGLSALHSKPFRGGGTPKLKPMELQAVASRMKQGTDRSLGALGTWIREEFGVVYTPKGLKNMLKKQLGFQDLPH